MKTVTVVLSTYNGGNRIIRQLDSIFNQEGVNVKCYIRDDGSKDNTVAIIQEYRQKPVALIIEKGNNVGWERSFLLALRSVPEADYYAFADQDDLWFKNKLLKSVEELEKHDHRKPLLFHCNRISCDENLKVNSKQAAKVPKPLSRENAVTQEYAQGCSIVINEKAKELVCRCIPTGKVPHDFWTGLICYCFGEVYYNSDPLFYHINHGSNASTAGNIHHSQLSRMKMFNKKGMYPNVAADLLDNYSDLLGDDDFLIKLRDYKRNFNHRFSLFLHPRFKRVNIGGTIMLKIAVLLGKIG